MVKEVSKDTRSRMEKVIEDFRHKLATVRTGRASTSLLDNITVEYYGTPMPLNQVATIHAPEASMLTVQPFDPSLINDIEKALRTSELGVNPSNDGKLIRIRFRRSPKSAASRWSRSFTKWPKTTRPRSATSAATRTKNSKRP